MKLLPCRIDPEKAIEFILKSQAQYEARQAQLETVVASVARSVDKLAGTVDKLAGKVDRLDEAMLSLAESGVRADERVDKLVSAIGALIQRVPAQPNPGQGS